MPQFPANPHRFDPYKAFKFRVKWDGRYVDGISRISPLKRDTEVVEHREGGSPNTSRRSPGRTKYEAVTLERGRSQDTEFESWANEVWNLESGPGNESALAAFRKDIIIELHNEAGQLVLAFKVSRCWPSEYTALSALSANGDAEVSVEALTLEHEGWERDLDVSEPTEPSSTEQG